MSPQRPAEGAGSGLRWPELEQPGCDPREGGGGEKQPERWKPISAQVAATAPDSRGPQLPRGCRDAGVYIFRGGAWSLLGSRGPQTPDPAGRTPSLGAAIGCAPRRSRGPAPWPGVLTPRGRPRRRHLIL